MPKSLHKQINLPIKEFKSLLENLYNNHNLSQKQIAQKFGCHVTTIENYFKKFSLKGRTTQEAIRLSKTKHTKLNEQQLSIIEGWLLSDGNISPMITGARFTIGLKYKEPIQNLLCNLFPIKFTPVWKSKKTNCYHVKTKTYAELKQVYTNWYKLGKKQVPRNFMLTGEKAYYWFVGDGCKKRYGIQLSTESFNKKSIKLLRTQLSLMGISTTLPSNQRINIRSSSTEKFYNFIGEPKEKCYEYKWQ